VVDFFRNVLQKRQLATQSTIWKSHRGWQRCTGCLIIISHFPQKSPVISDSYAERDLQLKASYASSPPCRADFEQTLETLYMPTQQRQKSSRDSIFSRLNLLCTNQHRADVGRTPETLYMPTKQRQKSSRDLIYCMEISIQLTLGGLLRLSRWESLHADTAASKVLSRFNLLYGNQQGADFGRTPETLYMPTLQRRNHQRWFHTEFESRQNLLDGITIELTLGWLLRISAELHSVLGCLIFIGHFPQKSPIVSGSFAEKDLESKASYAFSPLCTCRRNSVKGDFI